MKLNIKLYMKVNEHIALSVINPDGKPGPLKVASSLPVIPTESVVDVLSTLGVFGWSLNLACPFDGWTIIHKGSYR